MPGRPPAVRLPPFPRGHHGRRRGSHGRAGARIRWDRGRREPGRWV